MQLELNSARITTKLCQRKSMAGNILLPFDELIGKNRILYVISIFIILPSCLLLSAHVAAFLRLHVTSTSTSLQSSSSHLVQPQFFLDFIIISIAVSSLFSSRQHLWLLIYSLLIPRHWKISLALKRVSRFHHGKVSKA